MGREEFLVEEAGSIPGHGDTPSIGSAYRNTRASGGYLTEPGISNLWELFSRSAKKFNERDCLGWRPQTDGKAGPFRWLTYAQVAGSAIQLAGAISRAGVQAHGRCAVFSTNCVEWMITMQACNHQGIYCVPLYDTLGENAVEFIINHSESTIVFTSAANLPKLVKALPSVRNQLKTVVYWGKTDAQSEKAVAEQSLQVFTYEAFLETGKDSAAEPANAKPTDICTIMYTSGTTGAPKGVLITHEAVISCVAAQHSFMDQARVGDISTSDSMLSFLPLAHIYDRVAEEMLLSCGSRIGYFQGDVKLLVEDIEALKPTIFVGVPRVFDRIHSGILAKVDAAGGIKKRLFHWALARKQHFIEQGFPVNKASPLADRLVFGKVKQRMGGRVRVIISGAAPLAPHVEEFLQVAMCCPVLQGYGLTETCAASFISLPGRLEMKGTVGIPLSSHSLRLEGVPEMKYDPLAEPPRGEVCIKGLTVFKGYYKDEEKTREVLEQDGWFHTGDIAELTAGGGLKIIDRKKNIFKLAQGEYIAVEHLEANYKKLGLVGQIWVYGNSFESTLVAVVVPEEAAILGWAKEAGVSGGYQDVCASKQTKDHLLQQLNVTGKAAKLKGFEMLKDIKVESEQFSVENDCMTPTFKLKRPQLQQRYQTDIDNMYKNINGKR